MVYLYPEDESRHVTRQERWESEVMVMKNTNSFLSHHLIFSVDAWLFVAHTALSVHTDSIITVVVLGENFIFL